MLRLSFLSLALVATPAFASTHFTAKPLNQPEQSRLILRDTIWNCGEAGCAAHKSNSRPAIVCALLAREVGPLAYFSVAGQEMDAAELEKCNARAR